MKRATPRKVPEKHEEEFLSLTEAAGKLRCHHNTVRAWVRQGRIKPVEMGEEKVPMFRKAEVDALQRSLEQAGVIMREDKSAFPVVGIGASAGGVDALSGLLEHLPTDLGLGYVIVHHMEAGQEKMLVELLQKKTALPLFVVENGMLLARDRVYLAPAGLLTAIVNGTFTLRTAAPTGPDALRPIDAFFEALANEYQNNAIGIVLSGTGTDGTEGLRAIKSEDGFTIAQDATALEQGMPQNAREAEVVDIVRRPADIGKELAELVRQLYPGGRARIPSKHENEMRRILHYLFEQRGVDFTQYKEATIHRRIIRRMVLSKCRKLSEYSTLLRGLPTEVDVLYNDLLINVSSFFRDPQFYKALEKHVLPVLLKDRPVNDPLRIWVPACAGGEEVVSIGITLLEHLGDRALTTPVQIFATDLNERTIEKARLGIYKKSALQNVAPARVKQFFTHVDGHYQVIKTIRDMCVYAKHDLLKDPPFSRLDLISCQNVLIYLENTAQTRILKSFHYALKPTGFLALGKSETVTLVADLFAQPEREHKVYRKKRSAKDRVGIDLKYKPSPVPSEAHGTVREKPLAPLPDLDHEAEKLLLHRYVPPSVVVNKDLDIIRFRGSTAPFLGPTSGKASLNLLKMVRDDLAFELRGLLQKARKEKMPIRKSGVAVRLEEGTKHLALEVVPMGDPRDMHYLILFKEEAVPVSRTTPPDGRPWKNLRDERERRIAQLEQELTEAREQMRVSAEEAEAANQELQSANEEVVSSNEELQSINEELETSKEELQSINEEFATINEELQSRNDALEESEERFRLATRTGKVGIWDWDILHDRVQWSESLYAIHGVQQPAFEATAKGFVDLVHPEDRERVQASMEAAMHKGQRYELEFRAVRPDGKVIWLFTNASVIRDGVRPVRMIGATLDITERKAAENEALERARALELMHNVSDTLIAELDVRKIVQAVTDAGKEIIGAAFGAFFYNVTDEKGASYMLYTLSGAPPEAFSSFPMPRATALFGPTFRGEGVVRIGDVLKDPRYGSMGPHHGMPKGHLPVRSYLAVPVTSRDGKVLGGLFYGHPEADRFAESTEEPITALAAQAALAVDNANLHTALQRELEQQRIVQEALRASESKFRLLADNMDQLAWMAAPDGGTMWFNQRWEEFSGIPVDQIRDRAATELHHPDHYERVTSSLREAAARGEAWEATFPLKGKDGQWHWFLSRALPVKDEQGQVTQWFGTSTDITAQRESEEALRISEERFRAMGDSMAQLAWIADADGKAIWFNKQWEIFTGKDILNTSIDERRELLHHPDHVDRVRASHERGLKAGTTWEDTFPLRNKKGEYRWFLSRSVPVRDENGHITRWFGTNTDITAQREAEERATTTFRHAPIGIVLADGADGHLVDANDAFLAIVGYSLKELKGRTSLEAGSMWGNGSRERLMEKLHRTGALVNEEVEVFHRSGRAIQVLVNAKMVDIDGRPHALVHMEDITERKQAELAKDRLAAIVESSSDAILSKDLNSIIMTWNQAAERIFGYTAEEAIGKPVTILFPPGFENEEPVILEQIRKGRRIEHYETVRMRKDATPVHVSLSVSPIHDRTGRVVGASKIARDITERKRLEDAILVSKEQLQMVTDHMPVAVTRCSRDLRYLWVSHGYTEWIGLPMEHVQGLPIVEVIGEAAFKTIKPYIDRVLKGERVEYEEQLDLPERGQRWIHAIYAPLYGSDDRPDGWIAVINDITRRKELEAALQEADQRKDHFIATLAHELRNPLAPIKNGLELLDTVGEEAHLRTSTQAMMRRQLDQMVHLVDDLMDLSRISRGRIELKKEIIDMTEVIGTAIESSRPFIDRQGHTLEVTVSGGALPVLGDRTRLTQVLSNLLTNAAKYTNPGGRIELWAGKEGDRIVVRVKDNGIGIEEEAMGKVFDMFAQFDPRTRTRQDGGGLGIGLHIVKGITELHGGSVEGRSPGKDQGSEFTVTLPLVKEVSPKKPAASATPVGSPPQRRILLVDDNKDAALSMALLLRKNGHTVEVAHDGEQGIERLRSFQPELVFMDIGMPLMNGYEACSRMRTLPEGMGIKIVALSGWGQQEDRRLSEQAGFDRHLVKPIDMAMLRSIIAQVD